MWHCRSLAHWLQRKQIKRNTENDGEGTHSHLLNKKSIVTTTFNIQLLLDA